ncbi:hypothetical protein [Bacteroides helcogenes]|uniref:ATP-grasp domain-containing protein n=1 Tax=Bacteroides helcogenes (strain ATCC 35417 / DSM 20613 / JCM 6297 / CCUG 15421 / P 36-108) TaxID=693979 RepID=E6SQX1_BACT6|nr:hypothetical protein [Bacteroides helcogenes]ADV45040.1 hypothetical protein Bache_3113 [Bacteroides helcogenes P 36-108]
MKLYVFNPDADMALGNNEENYMPPATVRLMTEDLALLPVWYASPGSAVLAASACNAAYLEEMKCLFPLSVELVTEPELTERPDAQVSPWGWNPALRKRLQRAGLPERKLPEKDELETWRRLSSREKAMEVMGVFASLRKDEYCGSSYRLSCLSACREFVEGHDACVLKAPWSGSGKGLNWCKGVFTQSVGGWCERVIREQGFVSGEPVCHKVEDFAMEFLSDGHGRVSFAGYSLFSTNKSGAYSGNVLMASEEIGRRIAGYVSPYALADIRERLCGMLSDIYGAAYAGCIGVDMMVCLLPDGRYAVHPCVEINMRMNMGVVSLLFQERFMAPESAGRFSIEYYPSNEELRERHEQDRTAYPLVVRDGKMLSGYLPLVPVTVKSRYRAYVRV